MGLPELAEQIGASVATIRSLDGAGAEVGLLQGIDGIQIYAGRLDRGLSAEDVLESTPGTHWDRERGLNESGYIVPGAGGMGEVLNNSWC